MQLVVYNFRRILLTCSRHARGQTGSVIPYKGNAPFTFLHFLFGQKEWNFSYKLSDNECRITFASLIQRKPIYECILLHGLPRVRALAADL